jgi:hypothetical protein
MAKIRNSGDLYSVDELQGVINLKNSCNSTILNVVRMGRHRVNGA